MRTISLEKRNEIILENINLIYSATKYFEKYPDKDDLFQVGCIGMIKAYDNYNSSFDVKFTTYAYTYILGEMKKLTREDKNIKISRSIQMLSLKIEKANILLMQKLNREPTISELADYLELPEFMISEAVNSTKPIYSLDEPLNSEGREITFQDTIGCVDNVELDNLISLRDELNKLSVFEKKLIEKRYMNDMTQQQTAKQLGISQVQVSRNEQKILVKLKNKLAT